jgi:RNA polymerase sigma factor (sigma-70 family)
MIPAVDEQVNNVDALTDQDLLRRFVRRHDEGAFAALVRRHGPLVMGVCRRVLRHDQDTEDAFQAAFLVLARKAATIQNYESLAGWLYKVAYRIALRARANRARREVNEGRFAADLSRVTTSNRQHEIEALVDDEVQRLPEKYRTPVLLCYLEGRTNEEAARQLRCPTGTVKIRLLRGREMLRKRLVRQGIAMSLVGWLCGETVAQAAVPPQLLAATAAAGEQLRAGTSLAQLGVSSSVVTLARSWLKRAALAKIKVAGAVLLTMLLLVLTDHLAQQARAETAAAVPPSITPTEQGPSSPLPQYQSPTVPQERPPEFFVKHRNSVRVASAQ